MTYFFNSSPLAVVSNIMSSVYVERPNIWLFEKLKEAIKGRYMMQDLKSE